MTAFVLVPGAHTGGWVWQEVTARLREAGAEAHPVTLTGMRDGRAEPTAGPEREAEPTATPEPTAAPDQGPERASAEAPHCGPDPLVDLDTHIEDVVRQIDRAAASDVVLVGHCYGIHPVLGAAARRTERVARIVYLDTAPPQDGDPALALVPDPQVHEQLGGAEAAEVARPVAPPGRARWQRWGSTEGVPEDVLDRLSALAAPQPPGTLTRPLRISPEVAELPSTGVLCTANGSSIAVLETRVSLGDARLLALTEPRVRFLELAAGHWPMLSAPDALAKVLLRAAAGEGDRLAAPDGPPPHLRPFLLDLPERPRERVGRVDLYPPDAEGPRPAVVLVHGGPVPAEVRPTPRDWPGYVGYGRYLAQRGVVGVTLDHRLHDLGDYPQAAADIQAAVELVRADPRVDGGRVALWFFSGGGLLAADWLATPPPWLRCVAVTYPMLAPMPAWGFDGDRFRPAAAVRSAGDLPVVLTRVGREVPGLAVTVEEFLTAARECAARVEMVDLPDGHHGFETLDHTEDARRALRQATDAVLGHLEG